VSIELDCPAAAVIRTPASPPAIRWIVRAYIAGHVAAVTIDYELGATWRILG
jgi:hypothetical protein